MAKRKRTNRSRLKPNYKVRSVSRRSVRAGRRSRKASGKYGKLSPYGFGHAFGVLSLLAMLFYALMFWFADYNPSIIISQFAVPFSFSDWTIIIGLIEAYVVGYIGGWIFARIYNRSIK